MNADHVLRELEGMRALARVLAHGDADDLLQDAAVAALEDPPVEAPPRAWLAVVLRNRKRMTARAAARRAAREAIVADELAVREDDRPDAALERARVFERLATALVALEEPFRTTVIRRYLDGKSAAEIARELGVPAGTVRWRLATGLERLRAALDEREPAWKRAFAPLAPFAPTAMSKGVLAGVLMKAKHSIVVALLLLLVGGAVLYVVTRKAGEPAAGEATPARQVATPAIANKRIVDEKVEAALPPGQGKPILDDTRGPGLVTGRVINWSTGDGVDGAEIVFTGEGGATTVRTRAGGAFELAPAAPGRFVLTTISAPGFLPYAPELLHSNVHLEVVRDRAVRGITVFLYPAIDYTGIVVDEKGKPVAGATIRLLNTPAGEQALEKLETEWTSDKDGKFIFHAADDAVLEAVRGNQRGFAVLDGDAQNTHVMTIGIGPHAKPRDRTITGRVVDGGKPVANVLVRARPQDTGEATVRSFAFATTNTDGTFTLEDLDESAYVLATQADGYATTILKPVVGGARDVVIVLDRGLAISGRVVDSGGDAVPAYTLILFERRGVGRQLVYAKSIVDATGRFEVRVPEGTYDIQASASGWAPSAFVKAAAGDRDLEIKVSEGATLSGQVLASDGTGPVEYARVMREARGGGASAQPSNAGTVTRADGTFELTGIPPGPVSITIGAGGFHPKIEAGMQASDGAKLGPVTITIVKLGPGEQPTLELVGIGVKLNAMGPDGLLVEGVIPGGGAADVGIVAGDELVEIDGLEVEDLGFDGTIAKIRGVEGTTVSVTIQRAGKRLMLVVPRKKLRAATSR